MKHAIAIASATLQVPIVYLSARFVLALVASVSATFGSGDPSLVAGAISKNIVAYWLLGVPSFLGLLAFLGVLAFGGYRRRWAWYAALILGVAWLLYFPPGSILALGLLVHSVLNRGQYLQNEPLRT